MGKLAASKSSAVVSDASMPKPPADLWEQLAVAIEQIRPERQPNSFTVQEMTEKFGWSIHKTRARIRDLITAGKVRAHGTSYGRYYTWIGGE